MMFGSIFFAGFGMMARTGFSQRNMVIVSLSLSVGLGFTQATGMFNIFPEIVRTVFADNCVAVVFLRGCGSQPRVAKGSGTIKRELFANITIKFYS